MSAAPADGRAPREPGRPHASTGFLAALPLFLAYEIGLSGTGGARRSSAERVLTLAFEPLGEHAHWARLVLLAAAALGAAWRMRVHGEGRRELGREIGTGLVAGVALAPLLVLALTWLGTSAPRAAAEPARGLVAMLRLCGSAPWEEFLFRGACYGLLFLVVARGARFLGAPATLERYAGELVALLGSALLFAAFHLDPVQRWLDVPGESALAGAFLWRVSAGLLLGALFRWRGLGAASWAHALFNLGIALGVRPP